MMGEAVSEVGGSVGGSSSNSISSSGFSQDLFSPLQFCEVVQGSQQHQQHQLVSVPNNIIQATAVASPVTTLVSPTGQQLQQQHQLLPQQQQQLVLHSPHKSLQSPLAPPALLPPGSLPLPHPPSPHHLPPSAAPLAPLHHQHQHHLHQIQLQQLHHHQQLQQQHHHQQHLQPHHLHHHHHHHLHPQHLYTSHQQHLQQQQHQHQIHLQQQHQQQQLQQHQLQQQHQHQQQQQQQQQAQVQQKQKQQGQKQHKQKHSQNSKSAVRDHNQAKSSRKTANHKQQQSLTGTNKRSKAHHQQQQQVHQKDPQLNLSQQELQQKQTAAKHQHKSSQQQLQNHSQHSILKQDNQLLLQKQHQPQVLLQKPCLSQQYPGPGYQQGQLNQTTQQLLHVQHQLPDPSSCVLYSTQQEQGQQHQQWVLNIATSNGSSCLPAKAEHLQPVSIKSNQPQIKDSSMLRNCSTITKSDGDTNSSSPSDICDDKSKVSVTSTSLSSTADILSATLNSKNEDDIDLKPGISENVDLFSPVPAEAVTPNILGVGFYSVAQTLPQVTVSSSASSTSSQSGTQLGDGRAHSIKCESAPIGPMSDATLLPLTNALPSTVDAPPCTIPTMALTSSASVFISPGHSMPIASPVHMLNTAGILSTTLQSTLCSTVSLSSPSAVPHSSTNTFSNTPQSAASSLSLPPMSSPCLSSQCLSTAQHLGWKPGQSQSLVFQSSTPQPLFSQASILQSIPHASALQPLAASFPLQPLTSQSLTFQPIGPQASTSQSMPLQSSLTLQTLNTAPSFVVQRTISQPLLLPSPSDSSPTSTTIVMSSASPPQSASVGEMSPPPSVSSPSSKLQPVSSPHQLPPQASPAVSSLRQFPPSSQPSTSCGVLLQPIPSSKSSLGNSTSTVTLLSPVFTSTSLTTSSSAISTNARSACSTYSLPKQNFTTVASSPTAAMVATRVLVTSSPTPSLILKPSKNCVTSLPNRLPTYPPAPTSFCLPSPLPTKVLTRSVCIGTDPEPPPVTPSTQPLPLEESIVLVTGVSVSTNTSPPGSPGPAFVAYNQGKSCFPGYHHKENTLVLSDTCTNDKMILIRAGNGVDTTLSATSSHGHKISPSSPRKSKPSASSIESKVVMPSFASLPPTQSVSLAESAQLVSSQPQSQAGSWAHTTLVDVIKAQPSTLCLVTNQTSICNGDDLVSSTNQYWPQQQQLVPMTSIPPNDKVSIEVQLSPCLSSLHKRVKIKELESSITVKRESSDKDDEVTVIAITPATVSCPPTPTTPSTPALLVKRTWRRPWKKKKEREKKQQQKVPRKARRSRPRKRVVYHRTHAAHVDQRNGPPIDTTKTVVSRQSEENIDALKQKRQRIKLNRNSGREYINRLGKIVQARKVGKPCNCPMKCWERMGSKVVVIFNNFWDLCDFNLQNSYLFTCLKLCDVKRRYTKKPAEESRRQNTFEYFVRISGKHVRVCKRAFMSAHGLTSDKRLRTLLAQMKDGALLPVYDRRGKHLRPLKPAGHMESHSQHNSSQLGCSSSATIPSSNSSSRNSKKSRVSSNTNSSNKRRISAAAGPPTSSSNHSPRDNLNPHLSGLGAGAMYGSNGSGGVHTTASGTLLTSGPPGALVQTTGTGTLVQIHGVVPHCSSVVGSPSSGAHGPGGGGLTSVVTSGGGPMHPSPSVSGMQEPPHAYIPNGELYFPGHYLEPGQGMSHINQIPPQCQKMLDGPAYFMAGMKENTFHQ